MLLHMKKLLKVIKQKKQKKVLGANMVNMYMSKWLFSKEYKDIYILAHTATQNYIFYVKSSLRLKNYLNNSNGHLAVKNCLLILAEEEGLDFGENISYS